jgi:hypothetical protein
MFLPSGHICYSRWEEGNEGPSSMINLWSINLIWVLASIGHAMVSADLICHCLVWTAWFTCLYHVFLVYSCKDSLLSLHILPCTILYPSEYKAYFFRWKKKDHFNFNIFMIPINHITIKVSPKLLRHSINIFF